MPRQFTRSLKFFALSFSSCLFLAGFCFNGWFQSQSAPLQNPAPVASLSAGSFETNLTPEGIASAFGNNLAPSNATARTTPLPTTLNGVTVTVNGVAAGLFFVSAGQINYLIPPVVALGEATVNVLRNGAITHTGKLALVSAAPAIFTANGNGLGVPAAIAMRIAANGAQTTETIAQLVNNRWATKPINLGPANERVILNLFLCGLRGLPNTDGNSTNGVAENVRVLLGGLELTPIFAAKQGGLVGVDQINVEVPRTLLGRGKIRLAIQGGNFVSNEAEIEIAGATGTNPPTVTSFAPTLATAGETLIINGSGFATTAANNVALINGLEAVIESASANQLIVRVPFGAESGRVAVRTTQGEGSSASNVTLRTTISGLVTDTNGSPLPGVEVSFGSIRATTRNDGTYLLRDVNAGLGALKCDPSKLPLTPAMQPYSKLVTITANRDNLQATVALQPITGNAASIQTQGGAAEDITAPLLRVAAPSGSVSNGAVTFSFADNTVGTFPPGVTGNLVFLTLVANSRTPAPFPARIFSSATAQLTPFGVRLAPGGKLTFPNPDGLAANTQARLYKLDQTTGSATLGQFVDVGTATVSADGQRIETGANDITETSMYFVALTRALTTVTGRVVDSDNTTPARRALVRVRGQETFTDGNGGFTLRNVPLPANNQISVEASFVRPTGRTDRVTRNNINAVVNGLTRVTPDLVLPSPATQPNQPPTLIAPSALATTEGVTSTSALLVSDPDSNQPVTVTVSGAAFASIVQVQGVFNLRLAPGAGTAGTYTLTLRATDSQNGVTTQAVAVTVTNGGNLPPVLTVQATHTTTVGQQLVFTVSATDPNVGQTLTLTATGLPNGAAFSQTTATTGRFTWTPSANQVGTVTVTFVVSDGSLSDTKQTFITVSGGTWTLTTDFQDGEIRNIVAIGSDLYHSRYAYGVFRSPDNGSGWVPFNQGLDSGGFNIYALDTRNGYLLAGTYSSGRIYRTLPGNNNWTTTFTGANTFYNFVQTSTSIYAVSNFAFFISSNDGLVWTKVSDFGSDFVAIGSNGFYGIYNGDVYRSIDSGGFWSKIGIAALDAASGTATAITVRGAEIFVGTNFAGMYYSNNNGLSWESINTGVAQNSAGQPIRVTRFLLHNNVVYACLNGGAAAAGGGIIRFNDTTRAWEPFNQGLTDLQVSTLAVGNGFFYAGTYNGKFYRRPIQ